jgi:ABC-type siderophore export system fused ATPase/permease subunit
MELLSRTAVRPGRAVIIVTHDSRIFDFADRIAHMDDGRIVQVEDSRKKEVAERPLIPVHVPLPRQGWSGGAWAMEGA